MASITKNLKGTSASAFKVGLKGTVIYQGTADPTVTPPTAVDGGLNNGDIYIRQGGTGNPWVYNGSAWTVVPVSSEVLLVANNLSDVANATTARTNIQAEEEGLSVVMALALG